MRVATDLSNTPRNLILVGDALQRLSEIPAASVDSVITSPPYYQLRDYGVATQIGLEENVDAWVDKLRGVMAEVARVLKPGGSVWLNLGDSFSRHQRYGAPEKSLLLGPERLAQMLLEDGWTIRNKVIWSKTRSMPASVRDRLACTWEVVYFLTRSRHYYFDLDAIRVAHRSKVPRRASGAQPYPPLVASPPKWAGPLAGNNNGLGRLRAAGLRGHPLGKNPGDVWALPSANFKGEHFATFPPALVERPLIATVPERTCLQCGEPWQRTTRRPRENLAARDELRAGCSCRKSWRPGLVLDPFFGAGTVGVVAKEHGRDWLGIELNPRFATLATKRIRNAPGVDEERRVA
jgi:site-specific DNA-methyltransferase (adenine-specific)